jgi:hypothetical protein
MRWGSATDGAHPREDVLHPARFRGLEGHGVRRSPSLDIHFESVSVTRVQDHWVVRFDTPLFDHGDHFNNGSTDLLARTAKRSCGPRRRSG